LGFCRIVVRRDRFCASQELEDSSSALAGNEGADEVGALFVRDKSRQFFPYEALRALVGKPEECTAIVHLNETICLQLADARTVFIWPAAFAQECHVDLLNINAAVLASLNPVGNLQEAAGGICRARMSCSISCGVYLAKYATLLE
jgi:hypothetical protein